MCQALFYQTDVMDVLLSHNWVHPAAVGPQFAVTKIYSHTHWEGVTGASRCGLAKVSVLLTIMILFYLYRITFVKIALEILLATKFTTSVLMSCFDHTFSNQKAIMSSPGYINK